MQLMVIGSGGREHAIIKSLKKNPHVGKIYALPGNGGISQDAEIVDIKATDIQAIVKFAVSHKIDFCVVAPDDPLALGCVDWLHEAGIACFGPVARAAQIESSKVFAKELMKKYSIPTAKYEAFSDARTAVAYVKSVDAPLVVKADGLALGKGVLICQTTEEAIEAIDKIMVEKAFGKSGNRVVIEEFLEGPEVSVLALTDGKTIKPLTSSMDHKRAHDGDEGLNTGGMGAVAPNPYYTPEIAQRCMKEIFLPTVEAMKKEGCPFKGCLYFGLMLTKDGPKVIEYNCRFGDPETQVTLPLLKSDLLDIMMAVENEDLANIAVEMADESACCVVIASGGYPESYEKGKLIDFGRQIGEAVIYHSGTKFDQGSFYTNGGRVLGVTATGETLKEAVDKAYTAAREITFDGAYMRTDIGKRAIAAIQ